MLNLPTHEKYHLKYLKRQNIIAKIRLITHKFSRYRNQISDDAHGLSFRVIILPGRVVQPFVRRMHDRCVLVT